MSAVVARLHVLVNPGNRCSTASVQVGLDGGTIGRAPTNLLCLPDEDRRVSRVHAQIAYRAPEVRIISRAVNGLKVAGTLIEFGEEQALEDGAQVEIGPYVLRAEIAPPPAAHAEE